MSYSAQNQVNATVHDMNKVGTIIDDAVAAGANLSSGITFQLSDQNQGVDQALQAAVADALSKAQTLAEAGSASLGQVISITETLSADPRPDLLRQDGGGRRESHAGLAADARDAGQRHRRLGARVTTEWGRGLAERGWGWTGKRSEAPPLPPGGRLGDRR